jgi:prepilin-type N-terminal cleavage/methylation domain-containing protein
MHSTQKHGLPPAPIKALSASAGIASAALTRPTPTYAAGIPSAAIPRPAATAAAGIRSSPIKALSASAGIASAAITRVAPTYASGIPSAAIPRPAATAAAGIPSARRPAFTLVELLVVIVILAMLASLVTFAASRAMNTARNAAIKAEVDMLHMAIMNYKNQYGSFPPCSTGTTGITGADAASRHLLRLFPRITNPSTAAVQATRLSFLNSGTATTSRVLPETALPLWLYGFNDDPQFPVYRLDSASNPLPRKKLYDFDQSRIASLKYLAPNADKTPFIYIDSSQYKSIDYETNGNETIAGNKYYVWRMDPLFDPIKTAPASLTAAGAPSAFNADTFQLLSAGRDGTFFTEDDISNMWNGTWKDYLDSLKP